MGLTDLTKGGFGLAKAESSSSLGRRKLALTALMGGIVGAFLATFAVGSIFILIAKLYVGSTDRQRQVIVQEGEVISEIAKEVSPSVVSVRTSQQVVTNGIFGPEARQAEGAGTGIIVSSDGMVLTNKHVIPEETKNVSLTLADGVVYNNVEVIGRDPLNDLAVLKIKNPKNLKPAKLGNSDKVVTGTKVIAIGNALGEFQNTVTSGIISGVGRPIEAGDGQGSVEQLSNLFQTDAAINPGNSGGPLVNFSGEVIGINTAIAEGAEGLGFAIPVNEAKPIIESVAKNGKIIRPYLGVRYQMLTPRIADELNLSVSSGALLSGQEAIVTGSPAQKAGLKSGDVIIKINDVELSDTLPLASVVGRFQVGETVDLTVVRDGKQITAKVKLAEATNN